MEEAQSYEIRTLDDFLKVPDDRLDACLAEFADAIRIQRRIQSTFDSIGAVEIFGKSFTWIDDGKNNMSITVDEMEAGT